MADESNQIGIWQFLKGLAITFLVLVVFVAVMYYGLKFKANIYYALTHDTVQTSK